VNLLSDTSFVYTHKAVYKESQVALAQSCEIGCDCVFGAGTSVGDDAVITRSVLGRQCTIGKGVKIYNSILMSGVSVGDGAVICDSIIGDNVVSF
jgi:translation initiation factor eIF-2B subunit epsilon